MNAAIFADLEQAENVSAPDLRASLLDYAQSGAAISSRVVISVIARTQLSEADVTDLLNSAEIGRQLHADWSKQKPGEWREAIQYASVATFLHGWGHNPRTGQLPREAEASINTGDRYIAIFDNPKVSCPASRTDGNGMTVYAHRFRGNNLLFCSTAQYTGIGWGIEAFRVLVNIDNQRGPRPHGTPSADGEPAPLPSP